MDIDKERKLFQDFLIENFDFEHHEQTYFDEKTQCYENDHGEDTEVVNVAWEVWKAAKSQATPEGFVLVPKIITDEWMAVYVDPEVSKYCKEFEGLPFAVTEKDLPMIQEDFRRPIKAAHSRLMKVIEAQEQSHD